MFDFIPNWVKLVALAVVIGLLLTRCGVTGGDAAGVAEDAISWWRGFFGGAVAGAVG